MKLFVLVIFLFFLLTNTAHAGSFFGSVTATTTAAALGTATATRITVQADPDNTVDVFVGDGRSQPIQLTPGQSVTIHNTTSLAEVYVKTASGTAVVNFIGEQR